MQAKVPRIDDCSVPTDVHVPSSGSEAECEKCRQHIKEINTSHELVICFNNGWSLNHYVSFFGFAIPAFDNHSWSQTLYSQITMTTSCDFAAENPCSTIFAFVKKGQPPVL
ncbi:hypothetical protein EXN66_Car000884 [Channa argus]|uniref:Uncharacterized protein n=1 Tax=Channa argus TaxID=215402 RepID=A0A6G1QYD2_CHAAH|nr:hypothetical protein EXN66_Car000884 [Channa argus]